MTHETRFSRLEESARFGKHLPIVRVRERRSKLCGYALIAVQLATGMLQVMQPTAPAQPSPIASSFAGLLASLTAQRSAGEDAATKWNDTDLGDDIASISYESALRAHGRYRVDERKELQKRPPVSKKSIGAAPPQANQPTEQSPAAHDLRTASVTIRLSKAESDRMHQRAAEAGLTLSAYLRSCVLEADALRAQVKEALAEMRKAGDEGPRGQGNKKAQQWSWVGWIARLLLLRRSTQAVG